MRFGEYLIHLGVIKEEDLNKALDTQRKRLIPMGLLARQQTMLNGEDLFKVLKMQKEADPGFNVFERIALETGVLNEKQVNKIRDIQNGARELLGKILLSQGSISRMQLVTALKSFQS